MSVACELTEAVDQLLSKYGYSIPKSDAERLYSLWQLERKAPEIGKAELSEKLAARLAKARFLSADAEEMKKTRELIEVIRICNSHSSSKQDGTRGQQ